ncbi:hypothetical protein GCM10009593_29280 [Microlunatus antarcticus]
MPFTSVTAPAVLTRVSVDAVEVGVDVASALDVMRLPKGARVVAVATLSTDPASTSAWVITYGVVVVQVVLAAGAKVVVGQVVGPTLASTIVSVVSVCRPVLVTTNE